MYSSIASIRRCTERCATLADEAPGLLKELHKFYRSHDYAPPYVTTLLPALVSTKTILATFDSWLVTNEIANTLFQGHVELSHYLTRDLDILHRLLRHIVESAKEHKGEKRKWWSLLGDSRSSFKLALVKFAKLGKMLRRLLRDLSVDLTLMGVFQDFLGVDSDGIVHLPGIILPGKPDAASLQSQDRSLGTVPIGSRATSMVASTQSRTSSIVASIQSQDRSLGARPLPS
jgi:hypothetical protein